MLFQAFRLMLSPNFLFFTGTVASSLPYLLTQMSYFNSYPLEKISVGWTIVYMVGFFSFIVGSLMIGRLPKRNSATYDISVNVTFNHFLYFIILSLLIYFSYRSYILYGGIPIFLIAFSEVNINDINERQSNSGGVLGIFFVIQFLGFFYIPIMNAGEGKIKKWMRVFYYIVLSFTLIANGKRQLLFFAFFYLSGFYSILYTKAGNKKELKNLIKWFLIFFILLLLIFAGIASIRSTGNTGLLYPIGHYFSLPFINNMHMYNLVGLFHVREFWDIFELAVPTLFRNILSIPPMVTQPQLELTTSGGLYGRVFWAYGLIGVSLYCFILGIFLQFLYRLAFKYKFFLFIYPLAIWPTLMISTYDHFVNVMFFLLPIASAVSLRMLYTRFQKL